MIVRIIVNKTAACFFLKKYDTRTVFIQTLKKEEKKLKQQVLFLVGTGTFMFFVH